MLIRKLFKFEGAHVVRNCSTPKCKYSIHGHSYKVEVVLEAFHLDNGHMVYDFSLLKKLIGWIVDAFDHTTVFWDKDDPNFTEGIKYLSKRWISLPVSPSAEQLARTFFVLIASALDKAVLFNEEDEKLCLHSVIVHETETGYAEAFQDDAENADMGIITPSNITFSQAIYNDNQKISTDESENPFQQVAPAFPPTKEPVQE